MREARGLPEIMPSLLRSSLKKEMAKGNSVFGVCIMPKPQFSCLAAAEHSVAQTYFPLYKSMLTSPVTDLSLICLEMVLFGYFPNDCVEAEWLLAPWILLHVILEDKSEICFSPVLRSLLRDPWLFQDH